LTSAFEESVAAARERIEPMLSGDEPRDYLTDPHRDEEVLAVDPCAQRFAEYELDPPANGKGVARWGPSLVPALALLAGKRRVAALDSDGREQALRAVLAALAFGYVGVTGLQPGGAKLDPSLDIPPERLWQFWVTRLNAMVAEQVGIDTATRKVITAQAADVFQDELARTGLQPRIRKRMQFAALGQRYGEAGMVLRMVQMTKPAAGDPSAQVLEGVDRWPYER
jgi:hypothetical protein